MNFKELAEKRYSCRKFKDKEVEKELLEEIIETAIKAPTAVNKQPYRIFLLNSEEAKANLRKATDFTFGADAFLLVGYEKEKAWVRSYDQRNFADVDASIVATHIMMQIVDSGLATTWVGHFNAPLLKELYPSMRNYELIALFPVGYAAEDDEPSKHHFKRKTKEEVLEVL